MMGLEWLGNLAETLGALIPRVIHVRSTHGAVLFKRGQSRVLAPGVHVYWPIWSEPETYPIRRQTLNMPPQVLTTLDDVSVLVSVVVIYDIADIERVLVNSFEFEATIRDVAQGAVKTVVASHTYDDLRGSASGADAELTRRIRSAVKPYGGRIRKVLISDFARVRVFRVVGEPSRT
jgi:regulator of protease activity HflC (stomatin/prohibitin superfamily)